jgi:alcohol dehydrogenase class IV
MKSDHSYDFLAPPRIVFGWGRRAEAGALAASLGRRAFVIHGSRALEMNGALAALSASLREAGVEPVAAGRIGNEPLVADVDRTVAFLRSRGAGPGDLVVGIGGGSAIDLAKAACALAVDDQSPTVTDYLEGVGRGLRITQPPLPQLALPTTSGTGAEATKNAVITSYAPAFKKSLRSDSMIPRIVLWDPELTVSVPPDTTAATGMDAITQLIESYISRRAKPLAQALAIHGLETVFAGGGPSAILRAYRDGSDREAREKMAEAALCSGIALANSGLGFAHGVAPALGSHARVPHGLACALCLPSALRVNRTVREREIARLARVMTGRSFTSDTAAVDAAIETIEELCADVGIPRRLRDVGVREEQIPAIVPDCRGNSMSANPRDVSDAEIRAILEALY